MPTVFRTKDTYADTTDPDDHLFISHIKIYRSGVILAFYLIVLELITLTVSLLLRLPLDFLISSITTANLYSIDTYIAVGLILIKIVFMVLIIFQWLENYYEIRPGKVIYKAGLFKRDEKEFDCPDIYKLDLSQGFWGKLFNFGSITMYVKPTKDSFSITNIPSPHRNLKLLEKSLTHRRVEITMSDGEIIEDD